MQERLPALRKVTDSVLDAFISYRHADAANVQALVSACKRIGLDVWFDEQRVETFASIQSAIEAGLAQAKALLVWYSPAYPQSRACQWELTAALVAAQREGDVRRRILIVNPAENNKHIYPVELRDAKYAGAPAEEAAFDALAADVKQHCATLETPLGASGTGARPPWFGSASGFGSSRFIGRMRELWEVHSGLHAAASPVITDRVARPLVWITGMGGSGKSVLAEEYALRFGAAYPAGIVWLRAFGYDDTRANASPEERVQDRERQLAAIAESAGIAVKGLNTGEIGIRLAEKLDAAGEYLWVVDDLPSDLSWEATQPWLAPSPSGHTLVSTRRRHESGQGLQVRVEELDEEDAYVLLTIQRPPGNDEQQSTARHIVKALGLNPLGIELAAAAIAQAGYAEFAEQLDQTADDELEFAASLLSAAGESLPHREGRNLYLSRTLLASTRGLSEQGFDLLLLAAQVAVAPISRAVISRTFAAADGAEEPHARRRADLAIIELISRSLGRAADAGGIEIHTLVSRVVRFHHSAPERMRKLRGGALAAFFDQFVVLSDAQTHPELANDSLHARRLIEACRKAPDADQASTQARLLGVVARFEAGLGRYADSRELYEEALELSRHVNGEADSSTLAIAASLGNVLTLSGDFPAARALLEQALQAAQDRYGDDSFVTLAVKENFAAMLLSKGAHQAAIPLMLEVVQARMRTPGAEVPALLLLTLNNLANAQLSAGNAQDAEKLIRLVVTARTQVLGPDHPHTLASRNTLAGTLYKQGKTAEAVEVLQSVVGDMTRVLGATHPETLTVRSNLASLIKQRGDVDGAVQCKRELLELYRTAFGAAFPETIRAGINLAESLTSAGQLSEAETLLKNAVAEAQAFGETHELALLAEGNYAGLLQQLGRLDEARQLQQDAFRKHLQINGENHPATQIACENLAITMQRQQDWAAARALFSQLIRIRSETYGVTHFETLNPMERLARVCLEQNDYSAARTLFEHVVDTRVATLGEADPDTRSAMYNLGSTLRDLNESSAAAAIFGRAYRADSAELGPEHDDTLRSLEQWAMSTFEAADYARSATLWGELAAIRERKAGASDFSTLNALDTQANSFQKGGDSASARRIRERLVDITREAYGPVHPATGHSIKNLVALLQEMGDHGTAGKLIEEFLTAARAAGIPLPPS